MKIGRNGRIGQIVLGLAMAVVTTCLCLAETKRDADATADGAAINFGALPGESGLTAISAVAGADNASVDVYVRTGSPITPTSGGTTNMQVAQASVAISNGDEVVVQHVNGTVQYTTCNNATTTNLALSAALSPAWAAGLKIYEIERVASFDCGVTNDRGNKCSVVYTGNPLVRIPADSPCRAVLNSGTNNVLSATRE